ncbi:MAG TPA: squalene/phytoene synthase family protein, partial [Luteolibacter sp.]
MSDALETGVLKGVSRSFYLTLRLLPAPMRRAASLGYLLARSSDTIADTATVPVAERLDLLDAYGAAVEGNGGLPEWSRALLEQAEPKERILLERGAEVLAGLDGLPAGERALVREVVRIIVSGQKLDLERFAGATAERPVALADDSALEDYTWRVAGCVGAFWTKLGLLTLGERFSRASEAWLLERGIAYGKGLQLVNILRDLPRDLAAGRCYLPVTDPLDRGALLAAHARWLATAFNWSGQGEAYAE